MAGLGVRELAVAWVPQSPADNAGWSHKSVPPLRCWHPLVGARACSKPLAKSSEAELRYPQVFGEGQEEPLEPVGNRSTAYDRTAWHARNDEAKDQIQRKNLDHGDFYNRGNLVVGCVIDSLRPPLERMGFSIIQSSDGRAKASFAIVEQRDLAACAHGKSTRCLPVHVKAGTVNKRRKGQVVFAGVLGHPGLVLLVHIRTSCSHSSLSENLEAAYLFTGRSIVSQSISVTGARSKYVLHKADTAEELGHTIVDFVSRVFQEKKEGTSRTVTKGGAVLSVSDVLPLPTLQQVTTPTAEKHRKALEAYDAFFGAEGLLAGPALEGLLTADRKQGSRSGYFVLTCQLESKAVQLTAFGCRGSLHRNSRVLFRTSKVVQTGAGCWWKPFQAGEVDVVVCYTPCLSGIYLVPDFALAQRGMRSTEHAPGQATVTVRPYGGGGEKAKVWNRFLVDCTAPEDEVYARCRAILALAAEGKAVGWEDMPRVEELGLDAVTLPLPEGFPEQAPKQRRKGSL